MLAAAAAAVALTAGTAVAGSNALPSLIVKGSVQKTEYDGISDDLLSAGLNQAGLNSSKAPPFADPLNPTAAELRRNAIHNNYRAIVDTAPAGGMGLLWGPATAPTFDSPAPVEGLVPGVEYKALTKGPGNAGVLNDVPVVVQIFRHFKEDEPCIVIAPPSGSRAYYGGIGVAEWGLFNVFFSPSAFRGICPSAEGHGIAPLPVIYAWGNM